MTKARLQKAVSDKQRKEILCEKRMLWDTVGEPLKLFCHSFRAGSLRIEPQKLEFRSEVLKNSLRCTRLKPLAQDELEVVNQRIQKAWAEDIIERCESAWRSTMFLVAKPDVIRDGKRVKEYRIVTPFFNINRLLNVRATPLQTIEDIRGELVGARWFTVLDLRDAFFSKSF